MENERILVEMVPELEGRISRYVDKTKTSSGFEWLDDCPYHYGGRWKGKPFTYRIDSTGPDRAAVTVLGSRKIAVGLIHWLLGLDIANPLDFTIERTMSIDAQTSGLRINVKITNAGEGVGADLPLHGPCRVRTGAGDGGQPGLLVLSHLHRRRVLDSARGEKEMSISNASPITHPFHRFTPGRRADKPRYEAGGWAAALTSAGPVFMFYDPKQFDFQQFWHGGDAEWHLTFEPHTKPVDFEAPRVDGVQLHAGLRQPRRAFQHLHDLFSGLWFF